MKNGISIAIDGPAGSGKSTIAKLLAARFGYIYIDTGAMYRAVTLKALQKETPVTDHAALTRLTKETEIRLVYHTGPGGREMRVLMDGTDVSEAIRSLEVTSKVSPVAAVAGVRAALVKMQQEMAKAGGIVMDGRDIGTKVLPAAELKVYLTASVEERGKRRWLELKAKGTEIDLAELTAQIADRDYYDSHREVDPLTRAEDAILLDTTELIPDQVVDTLTNLAIQKGAVPVDGM